MHKIMPIYYTFLHSWLSILDRYLLREFLLNLFAVTGVFWMVYLSTRFARYMGQVVTGNLPNDTVFSLLTYSSISVLPLILPVATCLAVMLVLERMNVNNELTAIAACGISDNHMIRTVLLFSCLIAVIVAVLSLEIRPRVLSNEYQLRQSAATAETTGLIAGDFKESHSGNWTFYSQSLSDDRQSLKNVFIQIKRKKRPLVFKAIRGYFEIDGRTGNKYLVLMDGYRYEGNVGERNYIVTKFRTHTLLIKEGGDKHVIERFSALPSALLLQRGDKKDIAELQWRISPVIMTIVLSLIAFSLVNAEPRQGRSVGFFSVILFYIIYSNLTGIIHTWIEKGKIAPWLGVISVHVLMIVVVILLLNRHKFYYWLKYKQAKRIQ